MSCPARVRSLTCDRSDQYPHDNVGSHYVVSKHLFSRQRAPEKLMAGTSSRTLYNALENGGPAGLIYGYLFVWCGVILQALVMAEMASMYVSNTLNLVISFVFPGCYVTTYAGFGQASATIRTTPFYGEHGSKDPFFCARNMRALKAIPSRDCDPRALLQAHCCTQKWRSQLANTQCLDGGVLLTKTQDPASRRPI